ncbi:ComF family protein [Lysinibacillus sp. 54212]|uniref:ComF family protein n=1 Tax=Lysinibacillus sp. 54212 TaxID=3119829 RepID=UPI002FCBA41A
MNKEITHCLLCDQVLSIESSWLTLLERFSRTICIRCEQNFETYVNPEDDHIALYYYNEAMKDYMHRYKFMHDVLLAKVFRKNIAGQLKRIQGIIVPVPMHPEKMKERTFSQVDELLKAAEIPYQQVLQKTTTETQVGKTREERMNVKQLFRVRNEMIIKPTHYIIVDDIFTTGTTIAHAEKVLLEAGAKKVSSFSLIRG